MECNCVLSFVFCVLAFLAFERAWLPRYLFTFVPSHPPLLLSYWLFTCVASRFCASAHLPIVFDAVPIPSHIAHPPSLPPIYPSTHFIHSSTHSRITASPPRIPRSLSPSPYPYPSTALCDARTRSRATPNWDQEDAALSLMADGAVTSVCLALALAHSWRSRVPCAYPICASLFSVLYALYALLPGS